jgi:hypothetical protein
MLKNQGPGASVVAWAALSQACAYWEANVAEDSLKHEPPTGASVVAKDGGQAKLVLADS